MLDIREKIAAEEHNQWSHWCLYMLKNLTFSNMLRWARQIQTPYEELSEKEKNSDRQWADRIIALLPLEVSMVTREKLAALEHEQWAHWTKYMIDHIDEEADLWKRQAITPYAQLTEKEKDGDREWADKVLEIVTKRNPDSWVDLAKSYYSLHPQLQGTRQRILEIVNTILVKEGYSERLNDVWVIPEKAHLDRYFGSTIITNDGLLVLRIAINRSFDLVADTILHEIAHISLGVKHIRQITHDSSFETRYRYLKERYQSVVEQQLYNRNPLPVNWKELQPYQLTSDDFIEALNLRSGRKWLEDKEPSTLQDFAYMKLSRCPILIATYTTPDRRIIEFRQTGEKLRYVKHDANDDIVRDERGDALYMSDAEMIAAKLPLQETTIYAFDGSQCVGSVNDEWGATLIAVAQEYQKLGIGTRLYRLWLERYPYYCAGGFTRAGQALAKATHRDYVKEAKKLGKKIPKKVLKEYKDL